MYPYTIQPGREGFKGQPNQFRHVMTVGCGMQVCFRLTYYQGRAGLVGVDAVVGHSSASLGPPDKALKKSKAKPSKRKAANQKAGTIAQQAG